MIIRRTTGRIKRQLNAVAYWRRLGCTIGEECEIYPSASFGSEPYLIEIGNHVRINSGANLITHDGGVWVLRDYLKSRRAKEIDMFGRIRIGNNVHIGTNAMVMPGVSIGNNCIIGCAAVVTRDIPDNSVAVGVPARVIETVDDYYHKHEKDFDFTKQLDATKKRNYLVNKYHHHAGSTDT